MKREIMKDLVSWKSKRNRKPLLLTGVRQCGKTYILKKFGEEHFDSYVYVNLERDPQIAAIFNYDYDTKRILQDISNLSLLPPIVPGKTLLIIDEIQLAPKAITALKYFAEDMPELSVVGAGSLLGVSIREEGASFPVGKVDRLEMHPMSFKEFLLESGSRRIVDSVEDYDITRPLPGYILENLNREYVNYLLVGGMPEAVKIWFESHNLSEVNEIQDNIILGYENDFSRHSPQNELTNLELIWRSIPEQLAQDNNKFVFSRVRKSARAKDLEKSIGWLIDAGLIHVVTKVDNPQVPLSFYRDSSFYKIYLCDVGLLSRMAGFTLKSLLEKDESTGGFRGSLTENFVNNELISLGYETYFWRSGNSAELDFLIEDDGRVIPIEVKANVNTKAKSYNVFVKRYECEIGFRFSLNYIGENREGGTKTYSLPLSSVYRIKDYLK
ncbi:MAG: ATP-binding protein [Myxococcota bacterium]|jgi:predicted AAA+ superfamily ATPase|nr:ATP-binding protein [Myxococcota bacterium]MBP8971505.1 ATP-binding protein [Myxococcota bacterium]HHW97644.1 ATP-binding protein [Oligoflexales bacterium]HQC44457.1 ATP-binding protein [Myxococcota bacterium]